MIKYSIIKKQKIVIFIFAFLFCASCIKNLTADLLPPMPGDLPQPLELPLPQESSSVTTIQISAAPAIPPVAAPAALPAPQPAPPTAEQAVQSPASAPAPVPQDNETSQATQELLERIKAKKKEITDLVTSANTKIEDLQKNISKAHAYHGQILQATSPEDAQAKTVLIQGVVQEAEKLMKEFEALTLSLQDKTAQVEKDRAQATTSLANLNKLSLREELKEELRQELSSTISSVKTEEKNKQESDQKTGITEAKSSRLPEKVESEWHAKAHQIFSYVLKMVDYIIVKAKEITHSLISTFSSFIEKQKDNKKADSSVK